MPDRTVLALPAEWYCSTKTWQAERRAIFAREWQWIGREAQLMEPGAYITAEPAGFPVFVLRDKAGDLRAFHNVCRHRASKLLLDDEGRCTQLVCPYHGWRYGEDGALLQAPDFQGAEDFDPGDYGLFPVRVATWLGLVFICMDEGAPGLVEWLGPLGARIEGFLGDGREFHRDLGAEVACNWKNYVDNYQEGYHIPVVHPTLARDLEWPEYRVINVAGGSVHEVAPRGQSGQPGLFGWKYPNLMFNTYGPGISFMRVEPLDPGRCRIFYSHFRPAGMDPGDYEREIVQYGWQVSEEDQWLTPVVQRNLEAGVYQAGPLSPRHENGVWYFHQLVQEALGRVPA